MTRAVAILSAALLAATLGVAQDTSQSGTTGTQNTPSTSAPSSQDQSPTPSSQGTTSTPDQSSQSTMSSSGQNTTVQGCLGSSSMGDNNYTLTQDQTGTVYTLAGNTSDLKSHVGHEISVTGQVVSGNTASANTGGNQSGAASNAGSATASTAGNTIQVSR